MQVLTEARSTLSFIVSCSQCSHSCHVFEHLIAPFSTKPASNFIYVQPEFPRYGGQRQDSANDNGSNQISLDACAQSNGSETDDNRCGHGCNGSKCIDNPIGLGRIADPDQVGCG